MILGFLFGKRKKKAAAAKPQSVMANHEVAEITLGDAKVLVVRVPWRAVEADDVANFCLRYFSRAFPNRIFCLLSVDPMDPDQRAAFVGPRALTDILRNRQVTDFSFEAKSVEVPYVPWFLQPDENAQPTPAGQAKPAEGEAA